MLKKSLDEKLMRLNVSFQPQVSDDLHQNHFRLSPRSRASSSHTASRPSLTAKSHSQSTFPHIDGYM